MKNYKDIKDIKKGDKILSSNGEFVEVLDIYSYKSKEKEMPNLIYQLEKTGEKMFDDLIVSLEQNLEKLDKEKLIDTTDIQNTFKVKRLLENYHILDLETQLLTIDNVYLLNDAFHNKLERKECRDIAKELNESLKTRKRGE